LALRPCTTWFAVARALAHNPRGSAEYFDAIEAAIYAICTERGNIPLPDPAAGGRAIGSDQTRYYVTTKEEEVEHGNEAQEANSIQKASESAPNDRTSTSPSSAP
jgi:hypothetical protein